MKTFNSRLFLTVLVLITNLNALFGQETTVFTTTSVVNFNSESEERKVLVGVTELNITMTINIKGVVSSGELTIEVYDPKGEKHGGFKIGYLVGSEKSEKKVIKEYVTIGSPKDNVVNANLNKVFKNPILGNWTLKMIPSNVTGIIDISFHQSSTNK